MKNSFFVRLSLIFVIVLLLLGLTYSYFVAITAKNYFQETTQRLNSNVAKSLLMEVKPFVDGKVNEEALGKIMHSMMAVNPSLEVYLLDTEGQILSYVVFDKKVKLKSVSLEPVLQFIEEKGENLILGDDPRHPKGTTIFSATPVCENDVLMGYVYMVLVSEKYEDISSTLLGSYAITLSTKLLIITFLAAVAIGMTLIWLLTRNLRNIIKIFKQFESGDLGVRIPKEKAKGELMVLARTFNSMADKILDNIESLKKVDALRRELIANVSHDLRNPLAVIHGYIETIYMKDDSLSQEERRKYLEIILNVSEKLKKLVADLFELSKLETNQINVKKEPMLINELVQDASLSFEILAEKKNITIEKDIAASIPFVKADIALIDRVVQNLLDNAIKYTPENGKVKLQVNSTKEKVDVLVENTGKGISEEDLPSLFDRYYKANKEESNIEGSGLGLAITKKILDIHESVITVSSNADGPTCFSFSLPIMS